MAYLPLNPRPGRGGEGGAGGGDACRAPHPAPMSRKPIGPAWGRPRGTWRTCPCTLAAVAESKRRWVEGNRHTYRSSALKRRYGVTAAEYDRMREDQGYCCALCRRHEDDPPPLTTGRARQS